MDDDLEDKILYYITYPARIIGKSKTRLQFFGFASVLFTIMGLLFWIPIVFIPIMDSQFGLFLLDSSDFIKIQITMFVGVLFGLFAIYLFYLLVGEENTACILVLDTMYSILTAFSCFGLIIGGLMYLNYYGISLKVLPENYGFIGHVLASLPYLIPFFAVIYQRYLMLGLFYNHAEVKD